MVTQRDKIWSATLELMEFRRTSTAAEIRDAIDDNPPSKRTIRDTLDAMETKGFLNSTRGAGRAPREFHPAEQDQNRKRLLPN